MVFDIVGAADANSTITTSSWQAQPQSRGTYGILSTCFVTLALCTWRVVHLNLPGVCPDDDLKWSDWWKANRTVRHKLVHLCGGHQLVRQIGWLVIGLFAPELIAFAAFKQYWDARALNKYMQEVYLPHNKGPSWWPAILRPRASPVDTEDSEGKPVWSMTHSFYAVMGGFTFTMREGSRVYMPDDRERRSITLRHEAVRFVAKHEPTLIPKLTVNAIRDKSKASSFVKIVTLFQAVWFSVQCIVRMAQGLSISLLELTTFAHCICALLIGAFWLQKPLSVQESNPLEMPKSIRQPQWLMAILYTVSSMDKKDSDDDRWRKTAKPQQKTTNPVYQGAHQEEKTASQLDLSSSVPDNRPRSSSQPSPSKRSTYKLNPARTTAKSQDILEQHDAQLAAERRFKMRMRLAQKGWEHYIFKPLAAANAAAAPTTTTTSILPTKPKKPETAETAARHLRRELRDTLVDRVFNFPRRRHLRVTLRTHLGITLTGLLYGGLHLLAWDAPFGSRAEQALWRLAGLTIAGSGLLVPMAHVEDIVGEAVRPFLLDDHAKDVEEAEKLARLGVRGFVHSYDGPHGEGGVGEGSGAGGEKGEAKEETRSIVDSHDGWRHFRDLVLKACLGWVIEVVSWCRLVVVVIVGAVYFGLRVFIFVECLVNITKLPESAYQVVQWSQYVPHIS
ncbi:hypothetical protein SLS56_005572 [Neofusicoccum ribis]|uniref:Uncharacterized protein n=1 Tax=Neofusicoccum ribis TaxID=45134 RepID=A0ABR3ST49_9PEZI